MCHLLWIFTHFPADADIDMEGKASRPFPKLDIFHNEFFASSLKQFLLSIHDDAVGEGVFPLKLVTRYFFSSPTYTDEREHREPRTMLHRRLRAIFLRVHWGNLACSFFSLLRFHSWRLFKIHSRAERAEKTWHSCADVIRVFFTQLSQIIEFPRWKKFSLQVALVLLNC